jgi:hypothetical protein
MERIKQLKFNVFLYVIAVLAVFVALVNINRTYKSQADVMLISRNEATAKNMDRIVEDAREIPLTLSFYNRIVAEEFDDAAEELPDYKREAYWKEKIMTEKVDGSSIIRITIFEKDQVASEDLAQQSALSLADALGVYYNIKTELDTRIVNGPITSYGLKTNSFILFLESLIGGAVFLFLVNIINFILGLIGIGSEKYRDISIASKYQMPRIRKMLDEKPIAFDKKPTDFKKSIEKNIAVEKSALNIPAGKKSAAPGNLPIADESMFQSIAPKAEAEKEEKPDEKPIIREATPEEVKERLNKLLRGGF